MAKGSFLQAHQGNHHFLGLVGEIRYQLSATLNTYIENIFADNNVESLVFDLSETRTIDSTNLGLLAKAAKLMEKAGGEKIQVYSPNEDITRVLEAMCLDQIFSIHQDPLEKKQTYEKVEKTWADSHQFALILLEAHQTIMDVDPANRPKFKDLVATISCEIQVTTPS